MNADYIPAIRVRDVSRTFGRVPALDRFHLDVHAGHLLTLLGPSGSGKTTALRVIAGFERPDTGTVEIDGRMVAGPKTFVAPEKRRLGMVFQEYALFPHLTVKQNILYGVTEKPDRDHRLQRTLELMRLEGMEGRMPSELSGGEQQRVALARALAPKPHVILLDEPFSNLDAALRNQVRAEFRAVLDRVGATAVFVTHDQEEALSMSDLVAVMRDGRVVQAAPPDELYHHPIDAWVAAFLGDADFLPGTAHRGVVSTPVGSFPCSSDGPVRVMIRPEAVRLSPSPEGAATVIDRSFFGHDQLVTVRLPDGTLLRSRSGPELILAKDDPVDVSVAAVQTFE